jgi:hypothetical protein
MFGRLKTRTYAKTRPNQTQTTNQEPGGTWLQWPIPSRKAFISRCNVERDAYYNCAEQTWIGRNRNRFVEKGLETGWYWNRNVGKTIGDGGYNAKSTASLCLPIVGTSRPFDIRKSNHVSRASAKSSRQPSSVGAFPQTP